jgi:diguanylate cyclase (GGDEF)-like protein
MFDLDKFKSINDRFGHAVGDEVIKRFAEIVVASLRAADIVGRLGGEEFAAIVPGDRDVAALIGERVRANFEIAGVQFCEFRIEATVSIGAACTTDAVPALVDMIERADAALYRAKTTGRNRVEVAQGPCHPVARHIAEARSRSVLPIVGPLPG